MHPVLDTSLTKISCRRIPSSSLIRSWCLGSTNARLAATYISYAIQKNFLAKDQQELAASRAKLKAAIQLFGTMGYLRGAVMKVGQLLANLPQVMDRELIEIFESLQFEAPPMHYSLIREVFLDELGREPEELFASFDRQAFAAASLGQVHRARLADGTRVAVKIQYPDMARTIESDFKTLGLLLKTIRFKESYRYLFAHILDAKEVFSRELDYLSEAAYMERNRRLFAGTEIVVPRSFPDYSSKRVLTMEYLPGKHLPAFLGADPGQEQRNHFGRLISLALVRSFFRCKTVYADLHPGNFIFMADGRLGFLDFGCFRRFSPQRWQVQADSEEAMFSQDQDKLRDFLARLSFHDSPEELDPQWVELMFRQIQWVVSPITTRGPFDFADGAYVAEGVELFKESLVLGYSRTDSFYNWLNRAILGHRSMMYRLGSVFDYSRLYLEEMRGASSSEGSPEL
ncbi:ABC1 kinase family protein [Desulfogranum mediterraneum]|uniref:ABC1 kinase family protein n=1 Tax=Desulfogranum mediterraneum TaxID=160661 RepID=UPI00040DF3EC|nr:AarF/ABC1/UbiB kinase family protein [Desulfogranum mediterraneum]